jgi:ADP-heptose:LPS heptosyltransferase
VAKSFLAPVLSQGAEADDVWLNGAWPERLFQFGLQINSTSAICPDILSALETARKILILPNDRIGGLFVGLSTYAHVRRSYPHANISLLTTPRLTGLARQIPDIDKVITGIWHLPIWKSAFKQLSFELSQEQFDLAFCLGKDCSFRLAKLCRDSKARLRIGFQRKGEPFNIEIVSRSEDTKEKNAYLNLIEILGLEKITPGGGNKTGWGGFGLQEKDMDKTEYDIGLDIGSPYLKGLSMNQLTEIIGRFIERGTRPVVFYEDATNKTYLSLLKTYGEKICPCHSEDIAQIAPILNACRVLISGHSNMLHLGIAMECTCLVLSLSDEDLGRWIDLEDDQVKVISAANIGTIAIDEILAGVDALEKTEKRPSQLPN